MRSALSHQPGQKNGCEIATEPRFSFMRGRFLPPLVVRSLIDLYCYPTALLLIPIIAWTLRPDRG